MSKICLHNVLLRFLISEWWLWRTGLLTEIKPHSVWIHDCHVNSLISLIEEEISCLVHDKLMCVYLEILGGEEDLHILKVMKFWSDADYLIDSVSHWIKCLDLKKVMHHLMLKLCFIYLCMRLCMSYFAHKLAVLKAAWIVLQLRSSNTVADYR